MAGKGQASCPWRNIQDTLDKLTSAGFCVAMYEEDKRERRDEGSDADANGGTVSGWGQKLKTWYLAQVASPSNPTYMHGLVLNNNCGPASADDNALSPPCGDFSSPGHNHIGVIKTNAGYTPMEICEEERTVIISE
jgi:hypothetical protein